MPIKWNSPFRNSSSMRVVCLPGSAQLMKVASFFAGCVKNGRVNEDSHLNRSIIGDFEHYTKLEFTLDPKGASWQCGTESHYTCTLSIMYINIVIIQLTRIQ